MDEPAPTAPLQAGLEAKAASPSNPIPDEQHPRLRDLLHRFPTDARLVRRVWDRYALNAYRFAVSDGLGLRALRMLDEHHDEALLVFIRLQSEFNKLVAANVDPGLAIRLLNALDRVPLPGADGEQSQDDLLRNRQEYAKRLREDSRGLPEGSLTGPLPPELGGAFFRECTPALLDEMARLNHDDWKYVVRNPETLGLVLVLRDRGKKLYDRHGPAVLAPLMFLPITEWPRVADLWKWRPEAMEGVLSAGGVPGLLLLGSYPDLVEKGGRTLMELGFEKSAAWRGAIQLASTYAAAQTGQPGHPGLHYLDPKDLPGRILRGLTAVADAPVADSGTHDPSVTTEEFAEHHEMTRQEAILSILTDPATVWLLIEFPSQALELLQNYGRYRPAPFLYRWYTGSVDDARLMKAALDLANKAGDTGIWALNEYKHLPAMKDVLRVCGWKGGLLYAQSHADHDQTVCDTLKVSCPDGLLGYEFDEWTGLMVKTDRDAGAAGYIPGSDTVDFIKKVAKGLPVTWSDIGSAALDLADLGIMVYSAGTAKLLTSAAKASWKQSAKRLGRRVGKRFLAGARTGRGVARREMREEVKEQMSRTVGRTREDMNGALGEALFLIDKGAKGNWFRGPLGERARQRLLKDTRAAFEHAHRANLPARQRVLIGGVEFGKEFTKDSLIEAGMGITLNAAEQLLFAPEARAEEGSQ